MRHTTATLKVGNISHHIFEMDALYCVIKYPGLVKTKARWALFKQKAICNRRKVKPQMHVMINRIYAY